MRACGADTWVEIHPAADEKRPTQIWRRPKSREKAPKEEEGRRVKFTTQKVSNPFIGLACSIAANSPSNMLESIIGFFAHIGFLLSATPSLISMQQVAMGVILRSRFPIWTYRQLSNTYRPISAAKSFI
jgi:hypothetical protein